MINNQKSSIRSTKRRISTRRNDWRFRREIVWKIFRHETVINFHMNHFVTIIENLGKKDAISN